MSSLPILFALAIESLTEIKPYAILLTIYAIYLCHIAKNHFSNITISEYSKILNK
jgi:hypothetical protein